MKQKDKELLLKDLCARLPYGVICKSPTGYKFALHQMNPNELTPFGKGVVFDFGKTYYIGDIKPYLRPMSSMAEEEIYDLAAIMTQGLSHDIDVEQGYFKVTCKELIDGLDHDIEYDFYVQDVVDGIFGIKGYDWLNEHHFDYRGLIDKGLAIEVTEENRKRLEELGWQDVVCQVDDYTQAIWSQKFGSEDEVRSSKITHWSERRSV